MAYVIDTVAGCALGVKGSDRIKQGCISVKSRYYKAIQAIKEGMIYLLTSDPSMDLLEFQIARISHLYQCTTLPKAGGPIGFELELRPTRAPRLARSRRLRQSVRLQRAVRETWDRADPHARKTGLQPCRNQLLRTSCHARGGPRSGVADPRYESARKRYPVPPDPHAQWRSSAQEFQPKPNSNHTRKRSQP